MKKLELEYKASRQDCDIPIYKDLPLPMVMLQGWFNDQHDCFKLFFSSLTCDEQIHLFTNRTYRESAKAKYKELWDSGKFKKEATRGKGEHKLADQLRFDRYGFACWVECVSKSVSDYRSLGTLLKSLGTVEAAHGKFKPWFYNTKKIRNLNAADAARILARYGYLEPEARPLLTRGALRGAAIQLNNEPSWKTANRLEDEYAEEAKRAALEQKAAEYISKSSDFSGKFQMEEGEGWFCNEINKIRYPARKRRR